MTDQPQLPLTFHSVMADEFERFHIDNPGVYDTLVRLAHEWILKTSQHRLGIGMLYERARWEIAIATNDPDYKLNNNYRAFYARLIMAREPRLAKMFDLRASVADQWIDYYQAVAS